MNLGHLFRFPARGNPKKPPKMPLSPTSRSPWAAIQRTLPQRRAQDAPDEAIFWAPPGALRLLQALGRRDVTTADFDAATLVRVPSPPLYLLLRAQDVPDKGIVAYVEAGGGVHVPWGFVHPKAAEAARLLVGTNTVAFVDAAGTWRFLPTPIAWRTFSEAFEGERDLFGGRAIEASSVGTAQFAVPLKLVPGPTAIPDLWLLTDEHIPALQEFAESSASEELSQFTVASFTSPGGPVVLLREIVRLGTPRLGLRMADMLGLRGFVRVAGLDTLYLPVGQRLMPPMRHSALREMFGLDAQHRTIVTPKQVLSVSTVNEMSLRNWVIYVTTHRRELFEPHGEFGVFAFPDVEIAAPPVRRARSEEEDATERPARIAPPVRAPAVPRTPTPRAAPAPAEAAPDDAAVRAQIRALEGVLAAGGVTDPTTWADLANLKSRVGDADDAALCLESALFYTTGPRNPQWFRTLAQWRGTRVGNRVGTFEAVQSLLQSGPSGPAEAAFLGAATVALTVAGDRQLFTRDEVNRGTVAEPEIETLPSAWDRMERLFLGSSVPVSRKLTWLVLAENYRRAGDALGITRARERLLGLMNTQGLSETWDLPPFVRQTLALDIGTAAGTRDRADQLRALETLWAEFARGRSQPLDVLLAYGRSIFAIGFLRLGAVARAQAITAPLYAEMAAHEEPNRALFALYKARFAHEATSGTPEAWTATVRALFQTVSEDRVRDRVRWLQNRSVWLRTEPVEVPTAFLTAALEEILAPAERDPSLLAGSLGQAIALPGLFDYERLAALRRTLRGALRTGNDAILTDTLRAAVAAVPTIRLLGHQAPALGVTLAAAATLGDTGMIDRLIDQVIEVASATDAPSSSDLMQAIQPALGALRRLGMERTAERMLTALQDLDRREGRDRIALQVVLAEGYLILRDEVRATALLDTALDQIAPLPDLGRYESAVAVLAVLRRLEMAPRTARCATILQRIDTFVDTYTARRYFETHKVLVLERLVDTITDDVTFRSERVQAYLDAEEQAVRRQILAEWREVAGK